MNLVDVFIIIILSIFVAQGAKRGMIDEVLGLTGWIVAVLLAIRFMGKVGSMLYGFAGGKLPETLMIIMGFFIVLVVVRLAFQAVFAAFQRVFSQDAVTKVNKIGGAVFGFFKGALFISVLVLAISMAPLGLRFHRAEQGSLLFFHMQRFAPAVFNIVKKFIPQSQDALDKLMDSLERAGQKTADKVEKDKTNLNDAGKRAAATVESQTKKAITNGREESDRKQSER